MYMYYPGVLVTGSRIGVLVKVGGYVVLVGVELQIGTSNSVNGVMDSVFILFNSIMISLVVA